VKQVASLAMRRNGVIRCIAHAVGLIVAKPKRENVCAAAGGNLERSRLVELGGDGAV